RHMRRFFIPRPRLGARGIRPAALAILLLCAAPQTSTFAQHEHHGQQPPPQTKPKPEVRPQPTPADKHTTQPQQDAQHQHGEHAAPAPSPSPSPSPAPAPSPAWGDKLRDDAHKGHTPDAHEGHAPPSPGSARPAASSHEGHGAADAEGRALLVTSAGGMGIRVGRSAGNFLSMGQMGSGTAWQPASSPMYMWHGRAGEWLLMMHGEVKLGVNSQGGPRGVTKFESQNWVMPMAFRRVGRGTLQLRGMFSLEPLTFSGAGSPQLFQTGEVYQGRPIRDFQHPHDLFMELSAQYTLPVGERGTWYAYLGYPGEPALGPVAFMHRTSASENPSAPLNHHLMDSTHIVFGVFTTGFTYRWLKLEGSIFNGREPDDQRYDFEANPWTSRSARVTVAPNANWAFQFSHGLLKNPEFFSPGETRRTTASAQYNRPLARGNWATTFAWGRNREEHDGETFRLNGYLFESTLNFLRRNYLYTRLELVDREGDDLLSHDELHELGFGEGAHPVFRVGAFTFGAARDLWAGDKLSVALGGDITGYHKPEVLDAVYGRRPTSYKLFVRIRPSQMTHAAHGGHDDE
ncbi:MAG TPA: hypothetical protein VEQ42_05580, partial [Pyrinomonadaceae bacterium]|nr:hypothetical protein [Pyrinomonadaceae bacterium]